MLNLESLARVQLYATPGENEDVYARLSGATFPHNDALTACGAVWDQHGEAWLFDDLPTFMRFAESLHETGHHASIDLAEEASIFDPTPGIRTPLMRFLESGANAIENRELLELLLSFDHYLADPQATSMKLFDEFGTLGAVLGCEPQRLARMDNVTPRISALLKAIQLTIERVLHEPVQQNPIIGSSKALLDFLRARLQHRQREELIVIYLDRKNRLIKTDCTQGTVDHVSLHPREIAARALELVSTAVILAHNHPGGDLKASREDIAITRQTQEALQTLNIELYDHVIVGDASCLSFKAEGLMKW